VTAGIVRAGEEVEIYPENRRARVRGIQVHGQSVGETKAGQRAALNLAGVDLADLRRGLVIGTPAVFRPTADFGARVELLASAPRLRNRSPVHFHAGAAEIEGELRWLDRDEAKQGEHLLARIVLRSPALLLPGDRFVLRRFSPVETIGGGAVLDPHLAAMRRAAMHEWLAKLDRAGAQERLTLWADAAPHGISREALIARSGARIDEIRAAGLVEVGDRFLTPGRVAELRERTSTAVLDFHRRQPLAAGISKEELRTRVLFDAPPALLDHVLRDNPDLIADGEVIRHRTHARTLNAAESQAERAIEAAFQQAGLAAPGTAEVLAKAGVEPKKAQALLQSLLRDGRLVRVSPDLVVHSTALQTLRDVLASRRGSRFGVPEFKGWTGVSRKFAIPLLEFCDRQRITRREGDLRLVL
jgi:selenocysteine-specific elongation factor